MSIRPARFIASCSAPWFSAPSPRKQSVTRLLRPFCITSSSYFVAKARPSPSGVCAPTMPWPPNMLLGLSNMCIEPPLPLAQPSMRPNISAMQARAVMPRASA